MSPGQRQTTAFSVINVAGRTSFNIMWHYAKAAERGQRATHIMSAPSTARARCGLLRLGCAAGRRGSALWRGVAHSSQVRSAVGIPSVLRLPRCGRPPWRRRLRRHPSANINVNRTRVVGLRPPLKGFTSPPPRPCCTGCARLAVARSLLVPVLAIFAPCGPRRGPPC
ncbi:hypothetical protein BV924_22450 [Pectobacterium odoriferum]|uniref:Uncharacterized protein n=1 Tax=Pectobacterium odoriferum TaxID=78398 RepID=A0ABD6VLS1_9GAMM|nr:hypothetical protein BVY06_23265 [Pectobacterium odoriferum]POD96702.1 hypothetical protein BVY05_22415 [Pectobacterium odoriferum]POE07964.1 hypothetical protein BV924_22450 [Pectobacterium odoriferum]POE19882.1 hypothetical protein BV923_18610 [Pectobacterium odoriferum]POE25429.1 hypothetical protein BV926_16745 [Pectobacterium odoriferum]